MTQGRDQRPIGFLRMTMIIGAMILFASLMLSIWAVQQAPYQQEFFNPWKGGNRDVVFWYSLEQEKALYAQAGYDVGWLDHKVFITLKTVLGAYAAIFEMMALRMFGLCSMLPLMLTAVLFGGCEGRIAYHEKRNSFGNISSTRFRIFMLLTVFSVALCFIYLTLPFGSVLPVIGHIPLTVTVVGHPLWITAPYLWACIFSSLCFLVCWQVTANLAREI